mmetsp:Transcript_2073/g.5249  ORF Transcript_2073/g.5249 Transcript_2073/m.5249 type:complete len:131 (+) Transcript_2073:1087-1479(+)
MERIKETPMVFGYIAALRSSLLMWLVTFPIALVGEYAWLTPAILSCIAYLFISIEQMAIEIEGPFGDDSNDLPLEEFLVEFERVLMGMRAHNLKKQGPKLQFNMHSHQVLAMDGGAAGPQRARRDSRGAG